MKTLSGLKRVKLKAAVISGVPMAQIMRAHIKNLPRQRYGAVRVPDLKKIRHKISSRFFEDLMTILNFLPEFFSNLKMKTKVF